MPSITEGDMNDGTEHIDGRSRMRDIEEKRRREQNAEQN